MINKITKRMHAGGEGGFTLIELLVVIIIIAILAAIAIPMYLSQRQKGWRAQVQSDLRNAAVAAEAYYTDDGFYTGLDLAALATNGYNESTNVTMVAPVVTANTYCLEASSNSDGTIIWHIGNRPAPATDSGEPQENGC